MGILHTWSRLLIHILVVTVGGNDAGQNSLRSGFRSLLRSFSALVTAREKSRICVYQPLAKYVILAQIVLAPTATESVVIASVVLGIRGTLFLAYDLLGRGNGPVR